MLVSWLSLQAFYQLVVLLTTMKMTMMRGPLAVVAVVVALVPLFVGMDASHWQTTCRLLAKQVVRVLVKKAVTILASVHRLLMVKITDARVVLQNAIMVVLIVQDLVLEVVVVALALLLVKGDAVGYVRQIAVSHVLKGLIGDEYKGIRNCMARKLLKEYHLHCHQRLPACL